MEESPPKRRKVSRKTSVSNGQKMPIYVLTADYRSVLSGILLIVDWVRNKVPIYFLSLYHSCLARVLNMRLVNKELEQKAAHDRCSFQLKNLWHS